MKLVSYLKDNKERLGFILKNDLFDLSDCGLKLGIRLPHLMADFLNEFRSNLESANKVQSAAVEEKIHPDLSLDKSKLLAPVPHPTSCRDAYAFRQHVATARANRGAEMIPEFDQFPVFYFTNHKAVFGEGDILVETDHLEKLDFELEAAIVIGKRGKNIRAEIADEFIAGYMIMNDLSARKLQMEEMRLNLGPAKGKDFATITGPWLVTIDELENYKISTHEGNKYDLEMKAFHNGKQVSQGNMKDMNWTFAQIIERASYGVELFPGDIIGSGTVGTGCYLELNGTWANEAKKEKKDFTPVWLKDGDTIELEMTALGILRNKIIKNKTDYSILEKKKV